MKFTSALAILGALTGAAHAAATPVFHGTYEVFATRGACSPGEALGTIGNVRFQQLAAGSAISFVSPSNSEVRSYLLPTGVFNNTFKPVRAMQLRFDFSPVKHQVPGEI